MSTMMHNSAATRQEQSCVSRTTVLALVDRVSGMGKSATIFARNIIRLMEMRQLSPAQLAKESGISVRHIHYILSGERVPSIEVADDLARPFKLYGYHLQMPDFDPAALLNGKFDRLYHAYVDTDEAGRRVLETAADYITHQKKPPTNDSGGQNEMGKASGN